MNYIRMHQVEAEPMTRGDYNKFRGWTIPANENPADAGYKVTYPDGYVSWCPKAQFEEDCCPCDGMTFGMAIEAMKRGAKVARRGWNGKGQFVTVGNQFTYVDCNGKQNAEHQTSGTAALIFHGTIGVQVGWLASQSDMLSDDWEIVE